MEHNRFNCPEPSENRSGASASQGSQTNNCYPVASSLNMTLTCVVLCGTLFQLYGLPFALRGFGMPSAWLLLPIMFLQPLHWGLIHEAIHAHLLPNRRHNEFCARVLSIALGFPFDATRFGHLVHHRYSRHGYDRPDVFDGRTPYAVAWLLYRARLFGGVYLGLLVAPLIACIPAPLGVRVMERLIPGDAGSDTEVRRLFVSLVINVPKRRRTRADFAMTLVLYGTSALVYGAWWPMLLATMYVRGFWHSMADNIAHHGVAGDEEERARNYALPRALQPFVMNHHLHLTHHLYPRIPWTSLVALNGPEDQSPTENYFRAAFHQTNSAYPLPSLANAKLESGGVVS